MAVGLGEIHESTEYQLRDNTRAKPHLPWLSTRYGRLVRL